MIDRPIITQIGLEALSKVAGLGKTMSFTSIGLGSAKYNPLGSETGLKDEKEKVRIIDQTRVSGNRVHLTCEFSDKVAPYEVGEIGIYATSENPQSEILFAIFSRENEVISNRIREDSLLLGFDLILENIASDLIKIQGNGERLNLNFAKEFATIAVGLTKVQETLMRLLVENAALRQDILTYREELKKLTFTTEKLSNKIKYGKSFEGNPLLEVSLMQEPGPKVRLEGEVDKILYKKKIGPLKFKFVGLDEFDFYSKREDRGSIEVIFIVSLDDLTEFVRTKSIITRMNNQINIFRGEWLEFEFDEPGLSVIGEKKIRDIYCFDNRTKEHLWTDSEKIIGLFYE